ncbi:MAG: ankyrin repeat domain-containing protein [Proteobacteria bacterium]|nr:ankyrin repeat domain-containing protein [Pseudomonadota bacterium]
MSVLAAALAFSLSLGVQAAEAQKTRKKPPAPPPRKAALKKPATSPGETKAVLNEITRKLFMAVELNDMPTVKSSIEAGADLFQQNADGMTAADLAVDKGHFIVAHYLLSRRLVGATPPVALLPGKADKAMAAVEAKPKRTFSKPPQKPKKSPQAKAKTKPPPPPPAAHEEKPSALPEPEAVAEAPPASAAPAPPGPGTAKEPTGDADKPLAKEGIGAFFTSLVELITPGGVKPPKQKKEPESVAVAEPEKATEGADTVTVIDPDLLADGLGQPEPGKDAPDSGSIVETVVEDPDEIVVDVTKDGDKDTDMDGPIVELVEEDPAKLEETGLETMIADLEEPSKSGKKTAKKTKSKPKKEEGFLDKLAGMFSSDGKTGKPEKPTEEKVKGPTPEEVAAYDLPLPEPKPQAPRKFSPRFMDRLADFLEDGKEEEFKAWLPKMQVMNGGIPPGTPSAIPSSIPPGGESATEAPVPKKAPKAIVERLPLPESLKGKTPEAAPEKMTADKPQTEKGLLKGTFDKLVNVLTPDFASKERQQRVTLEPEEKLAQGGSKTAAKTSTKGDEKKVDETPGFWPVTEVETAQAPVVAIRKQSRIAYDDKALKGVVLSLGQSVSLENSFPPAGDGIDPFNRCVKKNRGTTLFCLETVDWPENMQVDFLVPTILYTGQKAIARYDQGIASRFHALFPAESFKRVAAYFHKRFGAPTDVWNRSIAPFAKPRQDNPTLAWRSIDAKTGAVTVLEIRKYDDSRGGFPDTNRGAVMLYLANTPSIFPQVSSHELMRLSRARMSAPGSEPANQPPAPEAKKGAPGKKSKADPKQMTAEEMQAERRKRKAAEKAGAPGKAEEDLFALPPDPEGR